MILKKLVTKLEAGFNSLSFFLINIMVIAATASIAAGGKWVWIYIFFASVIAVIFDELFEYHGELTKLPELYMEILLQSALPMIFILTLVALNATATVPVPLVDDALQFVGFDTAASREKADPLLVFIVVGFIYGAFGITVAHELCHRTSLLSQIAARWLLAFSWDTGFAIEHIHGHHKNVGLEKDPATARRNEGLPQFLCRSIFGQLKGAHLFEQQRLSRVGKRNSILANKFFRGQLMSVSIISLYIFCLGWMKGPLLCFLAAAVGKVLLEITNYIEHYGLVRVPGCPVENRHSWDCHKRVSCFLLFNLPLHADHHRFASRRFYNLRAAKQEDAPILPRGYMSMAFVALFPPLWKKLMHSRLAAWDRHLASVEELKYLERKNIKLNP
jgi:fatty acid desaturase